MCVRMRSRLGTPGGGSGASSAQGWRVWRAGPEPPPGVVSSLQDLERKVNILAAAPCLAPYPDPDPAF